ncbi:MAG: hypothetical protein LBL47_03375 [Lactobacillus sp.]|nr:hypothetical protein [Lactobacillus sp.]
MKAFAIAALVTTFTACGGNSTSGNASAKSSAEVEVIETPTLKITIDKGKITAEDVSGNTYVGVVHPKDPDFYEFQTKDPENGLVYRALFRVSSRTLISTFADKRVFHRLALDQPLILADGSKSSGTIIGEGRHKDYPAVRAKNYNFYTPEGVMVFNYVFPTEFILEDGYIVQISALKKPMSKVDISNGKLIPIPKK